MIARLLRERDEARQMLAEAERTVATGGMPAPAGPAGMQAVANGKRGNARSNQK